MTMKPKDYIVWLRGNTKPRTLRRCGDICLTDEERFVAILDEFNEDVVHIIPTDVIESIEITATHDN